MQVPAPMRADGNDVDRPTPFSVGADKRRFSIAPTRRGGRTSLPRLARASNIARWTDLLSRVRWAHYELGVLTKWALMSEAIQYVTTAERSPSTFKTFLRAFPRTQSPPAP